MAIYTYRVHRVKLGTIPFPSLLFKFPPKVGEVYYIPKSAEHTFKAVKAFRTTRYPVEMLRVRVEELDTTFRDDPALFLSRD